MQSYLKLMICVAWLPGFVATAYADDDGLSSQFQTMVGNTDPLREDWSLHGQATEIYQGYPSFPAAYSGPESLYPDGQWKSTSSATLFLGRRLWEGAAAYYDPEFYQGKALSSTLGVAGFPNGEGSKAGSYQIKENPARLYIQQVIGLGGPTENIKAGQNQLADVEDISRVTITAGKFAASDFFDDNTYSHDPRTQFLNESLMDSAAWDYPANSRGYDRGAVAELNHESWALRYGIFQEPVDPNESDLAFHGLGSVGQVAELEERYTIEANPGKIRFLTFLNRDRAAYYSDAFALGGDVNTAVDEARGYGHDKFGFAISAEQQLTDTLGAFTRLSWNNGKTEEWTFTQVDESAAVGLSLNGKKWDRPDDVWGIAGVVNGISSDQRKFLEEGGEGFIIGDGQLSYSPEMILETYYAFKINQYATFSPDYQFIANPAYNEDRGPVNIFAVRLHLEF